VHETKPEHLQTILNDQFIRPAKDINRNKYKTARYNYVYLGVLFKFLSMFPSNIKKSIGGEYFTDKVVLFFTEELFTDLTPLCWSPDWRFGNCSKKGSIQYNSRKSPDENISSWQAAYSSVYTRTPAALGKSKAAQSLYAPIHTLGQNELVFSEAIPMRHCVGIFQLGGDKDRLGNIPGVVVMTNTDELTDFLQRYGYSAH